MREFTKVQIASMEELRQFSHTVNRYLFLENKYGEKFVYLPKGPIPSQFFRRIWAKMVGRPDIFDFVLFPEYRNMLITYENFRKDTVKI